MEFLLFKNANQDQLVQAQELQVKCFSNPGEQWLSESRMVRYISSVKNILILATNLEKEIVGSLLWTEQWGPSIDSNLSQLAIHESYRRQGIGRELLKRFLQECKSEYYPISLYVRADNEAAKALYKAVGFQFISRLVDYYGTGQDGFFMQYFATKAKENK